MKEIDDLVTFIAQLKLGNDKLSLHDHTNMIDEESIEAKYSTMTL